MKNVVTIGPIDDFEIARKEIVATLGTGFIGNGSGRGSVPDEGNTHGNQVKSCKLSIIKQLKYD